MCPIRDTKCIGSIAVRSKLFFKTRNGLTENKGGCIDDLRKALFTVLFDLFFLPSQIEKGYIHVLLINVYMRSYIGTILFQSRLRRANKRASLPRRVRKEESSARCISDSASASAS